MGGTTMAQGLTRADISDIIAERGVEINHGIRGMRRELARMDKNGNKLLERPEFEAGLRSCGVYLSELEMDEVFRHFDFNADGSVHYDEFLNGVRKPLSAHRLLHVRKVFNTLDAGGNNVVYLADIGERFNAMRTPQVKAGADGAAVRDEFVEVLDSKKTSSNGLVSFAEFSDYYADVGNMMANDYDFATMIEDCWGVPGTGLGYTEVHKTASGKALQPRNPDPLPDYVPMVRLPDHLDPNMDTMSKQGLL